MVLLAFPAPSICLTKLALAVIPPRHLKLKARIMVGSQRLLSSASKKKMVSKNEEEVKSTSEVKIQTCGDFETMTIHQLRTISKNFGISARGSKNDLVSTLKSFLISEEDDQNHPGTSQMKQSDLESPSSTKDAKNLSVKAVPKGISSKRKAKNITSGDQIHVPALVENGSRFQQKERRGKPPRDGDASKEVNSESPLVKQRVSIKTSSVSDTKTSKTKRKKPSQNEDEAGGSPDKVGFPTNSSEPWTILAHKKPQQGWIPYNPKTMRAPPPDADGKFVKLCSWNVNGLRALLKVDDFSAFAQREDFDILCLQETKLQDKDVEKIKESLLDGYANSFWTCSVSKLGYSGAAVISRVKPLSVRYGLGLPDHDSEGRLVTVEFDTFYLISGYVPNSGDGLRRLTYRVTQWDPSLGNYMKELEKSKPVILTGDLNCAHQEIDIYNPAGNKRSAGFTKEERESFEVNFLSQGFVDTFRKQHPGVVGYTYWGYRHGGRVSNKGWRLDYFLVSESIADQVHDSYIIPDITGSDHCPIGLILKL